MVEFIPFPDHAIEAIIENLFENTPAKWGILTAPHMLEHLLLPIAISQGKLIVPLVTPVEKVEKVKRIMLLSDLPFQRNFSAPFLGSGLQPLKFQNFEESKKELMNEISAYIKFWEVNQNALFTHPIFGSLDRNEWHLFHRKHFTHHFIQFNLL